MSANPTTAYAYWDYTASKKTQNHGYLWPAVLMAARQYVGEGSRILDAGCGSGAFSRVLKQDLRVEVDGCDLSESGIALAREHAPDCRFLCLSVYDDFAKEFGTTWDAVVSIEVIEHLYDPHTFLKRAHEALLPGGVLILTTPYHGYFKNLLIAASGRYDKHHNPLNTGGHVKFWSHKTISAAMEDAGFEVIGFEGVGRWPLLWKSMVVVARRPRQDL